MKNILSFFTRKTNLIGIGMIFTGIFDGLNNGDWQRAGETILAGVGVIASREATHTATNGNTTNTQAKQ